MIVGFPMGSSKTLYKWNGNTAKFVKLSFLSGIYRRACQISSTLGFDVFHNFFVFAIFFLRFQIIYHGTIAHAAYEYFQVLTKLQYIKKEKFPLFARSKKVRERVMCM